MPLTAICLLSEQRRNIIIALECTGSEYICQVQFLTSFCSGPRTSWGLEISGRIANIEIKKLNCPTIALR